MNSLRRAARRRYVAGVPLEYLVSRWLLIVAVISAVALAATAVVSPGACAAVIVALVGLDAATHRAASAPPPRAAVIVDLGRRRAHPRP